MFRYLIFYKINISEDLINPIYEEYNAIIDGNESGPGEVDIINFRMLARKKHNTRSNPIIMNIMKLK